LNIGEEVLVKVDGKVVQMHVLETYAEDVKLTDGIVTIMRKYWELRKVSAK
jgi:hypothetical protein